MQVQRRSVSPALVRAAAGGEADLLAAHLIEALKQELPAARFFGVGGPKMQGAGFKEMLEKMRSWFKGNF